METGESGEFIELLSKHQEVLFFFIRSLVHNVDIANDILQETNMVLWKQMDEFEKGSSFLSWSRTVAKYQVLAWSRDHGREKLMFNDDLVQSLALSAEKRSETYLAKKEALKKCLDILPEHGREIIEKLYHQNISVADLARQESKTPNAISQILFRMRNLIKDCMNSRLKDEFHEE